MIKIFFILIVNVCLFGNTLTTVQSIKKVSKLKSVSSVKYVTQVDLKRATKSENIDDLLSLAEKENKVSFVDQYKYRVKFNKFEDGDFLLLKCLKSKSCDMKKYSEIIEKSTLHRKLIRKNPTKSLAFINHKVGQINENLMDKYFTSTGWTKIEGEIGRNGIDGLYIKRNKNGSVKDILIVESKYNKSGLQHTKNGKQMSNEWITKKISDLQKKYPNISDYKQIEKFVENDVYRSLLWNLKVNDDNLVFDVVKIHDKTGKIEKKKLVGGEKIKIMQTNNNIINIDYPQNEFQNKVLGWYKEEIKNIKI